MQTIHEMTSYTMTYDTTLPPCCAPAYRYSDVTAYLTCLTMNSCCLVCHPGHWIEDCASTEETQRSLGWLFGVPMAHIKVLPPPPADPHVIWQCSLCGHSPKLPPNNRPLNLGAHREPDVPAALRLATCVCPGQPAA